MRTGAEKFEGVGGGHDAAAGARITKDKLDGFLDYLEQNVLNVQSAGNSQ
jgi:RecJ-like exonuclease